MFSNRIANSSKFLQMPVESQLLYFHMVLRADDDGVVESYPIMRLLGFAPDNFKVLIAKRFIHQLNEDQVVLIKDWLEHNKIRADRKVDSIYKSLIPKSVDLIEPKPRSDVKDNSNRIGGQSTVGLSQVKLSQVKSSKDNKVEQSSTELKVIEEIISKYIEITDISNKTNQMYIKRLFNSYEGSIEKIEGLCKIIEHYNNTGNYPYSIYSVRSLFEKKEKIISRYKTDKAKKVEVKKIIGLEKFI